MNKVRVFFCQKSSLKKAGSSDSKFQRLISELEEEEETLKKPPVMAFGRRQIQIVIYHLKMRDCPSPQIHFPVKR